MPSIRVIRLLEYTYASPEAAEDDMARWTVPPQGVKHFGNEVIRSTVILDLAASRDGMDWFKSTTAAHRAE